MKPGYSLTLLLAGTMLGGMACPGSPKAPTYAWRPECPTDSIHIIVVDTVRKEGSLAGVQVRTVTRIPLADSIANVPEFHDCQRFVVKEDERDVYDSLYAIFASFRLASLARRLDSLRDTIVYPHYNGKTVAVPAAEIYSYGGTYTTLGIRPNFNCLYLFGGPGNWGAKMVPIGTHEQNCSDPLVIDRSGAGTPLAVREATSTGFGDLDYPAVARWDWDAKHSHQFIGIKCGAAWCEVGETGFGSSPAVAGPTLVAVPGPPPTTTEIGRAFKIKGWYDWQRLAELPPGTTKPRPSQVWGTLIPDPVLGRPDHDAVSYFAPTGPRKWVHTATAVVTADYSSKQLELKKGENQIFICHGSATWCGVPDPTPPCPSPADGTWWTMVQPLQVGARPTYRCVTYRPHLPFSIRIPGSARWRWSESDESGWVRCTNGCCTV